jgi:hypothetical protein
MGPPDRAAFTDPFGQQFSALSGLRATRTKLELATLAPSPVLGQHHEIGPEKLALVTDEKGIFVDKITVAMPTGPVADSTALYFDTSCPVANILPVATHSQKISPL